MSEQSWDATVHGDFYSLIKDLYPLKQELRGVELSLRPTPQGLIQRVHDVGTKMQFRNEKQDRLFQLSPDMLTTNVLKPYKHWDHFKAMIQSGLKNYVQLREITGVRRVGLRYINQIGFSTSEEQFFDYFSRSKYTPQVLEEANYPFLQRMEIVTSKNRRIIITFNGKITSEKGGTFIFDLDHIYEGELIQETAVGSLLEEMHSEIERIFEECITDELRKKME